MVVDSYIRWLELRNTIFAVMDGTKGKCIGHKDLFIDEEYTSGTVLIGNYQNTIIECQPRKNDRWLIYYGLRPNPILRGIDNWETIARLINFLEYGMIERGVIPA